MIPRKFKSVLILITLYYKFKRICIDKTSKFNFMFYFNISPSENLLLVWETIFLNYL